MVPVSRKLLLFAMCLAFAITVPAVLLTTAGYRFNVLKNRVEKTGIIEVESVPSGATVYLNGAAQGSVTPASLRRLLPEDYRIKITLAGYLNWEKKLSVDPGHTTFTSRVVLIKDSLPSLVEPGDFSHAVWSPDGMTLGAVRVQDGTQELVVWNRPRRSLAVMARVPIEDAEENELLWSPDSQKLLHVKRTESGTVATVHSPNNARPSTTVSTNLPKSDYRVTWSSNSQRLVFIGRSGAFLVSVDGGSVHPLAIGTDVLDASAREDQALVLRLSEDGASVLERVAWRADGEPGEPEELTLLPAGCERIVEWRGPSATIADRRNKQLLILDTNQPDKKMTLPGQVLQRSGGSGLITWTDHEVYLADTTTGKAELVTRLAEMIGGCVWHPSGTHIICSTDARIFASETDGRGGYNTWQLALGSRLDGLIADSTSKKIYFVANIGQSLGVYERLLQ